MHAIAHNLGALTAQGRNSILEDTGFSFVNCKVTGSGALYLGRAWGPFSRVVFAYTYMDNIIIPKGWYNWGDPNREMYVSLFLLLTHMHIIDTHVNMHALLDCVVFCRHIYLRSTDTDTDNIHTVTGFNFKNTSSWSVGVGVNVWHDTSWTPSTSSTESVGSFIG